MPPDTGFPYYEMITAFFSLLFLLGFPVVIFYWAIKAFIKHDKKLEEEILKPFFYIIAGSILTIIIRNALIGSNGFITSILPFLSCFFLGFFFYALTVNYLDNYSNANKESNHLKGLIVTFFVYMIILILTIR